MFDHMSDKAILRMLVAVFTAIGLALSVGIGWFALPFVWGLVGVCAWVACLPDSASWKDFGKIVVFWPPVFLSERVRDWVMGL